MKKLFEEALRKYPVNDDGKWLAEINAETGEFISGARLWDKAASKIEDAREDPDHPVHEILGHAIMLANGEIETLLQMKPKCEADRNRIAARLNALSSLTQINREAGRHADHRESPRGRISGKESIMAMQTEIPEALAAIAKGRDHMLKLAQSEAGIAARQDELDSDPWLIGSQNGVVDLHTGTLLAHDPAMKLTRLTRANYDRSATCPLLLELLDRIFAGDQETIATIQRMVG